MSALLSVDWLLEVFGRYSVLCDQLLSGLVRIFIVTDCWSCRGLYHCFLESNRAFLLLMAVLSSGFCLLSVLDLCMVTGYFSRGLVFYAHCCRDLFS